MVRLAAATSYTDKGGAVASRFTVLTLWHNDDRGWHFQLRDEADLRGYGPDVREDLKRKGFHTNVGPISTTIILPGALEPGWIDHPGKR